MSVPNSSPRGYVRTPGVGRCTTLTCVTAPNTTRSHTRGHCLQVEAFGAHAGTRDCGAGQIKEVNVKDFMCHRNMTVHFGEHMNFICGPNGSGKSAILQARPSCH